MAQPQPLALLLTIAFLAFVSAAPSFHKGSSVQAPPAVSYVVPHEQPAQVIYVKEQPVQPAKYIQSKPVHVKPVVVQPVVVVKPVVVSGGHGHGHGHGHGGHHGKKHFYKKFGF